MVSGQIVMREKEVGVCALENDDIDGLVTFEFAEKLFKLRDHGRANRIDRRIVE